MRDCYITSFVGFLLISYCFLSLIFSFTFAFVWKTNENERKEVENSIYDHIMAHITSPSYGCERKLSCLEAVAVVNTMIIWNGRINKLPKLY